MKYLAKFIVWIIGWKIVRPVPPDMKKCIIVIAPHTSNWDFVLGRIFFWAMAIKVKFLIKKEVFFFPAGVFFRALGALPVDRTRGTRLVTSVISLFEKYKTLRILITPEGTRKKVLKWKKGFYYIAHRAKVPIVLGYIDYKKKEVGVLKVFKPTGNIEDEFPMIEDYYRGISARFPENFNLSDK